MTDFESPQDPSDQSDDSITTDTVLRVTQAAHWLGRQLLEYSDKDMLEDMIRDGSRALAVFNEGPFGTVSDFDGQFFSFPRTRVSRANPEDDMIMLDLAPSPLRSNSAPRETTLEIKFYVGGTVELGERKMRRVAFLKAGPPKLSDALRTAAAEGKLYEPTDWRQLQQQEGRDLTVDLGDLSRSLDEHLGLSDD